MSSDNQYGEATSLSLCEFARLFLLAEWTVLCVAYSGVDKAPEDPTPGGGGA